MTRLTLPLSKEDISKLKKGDIVYLSGEIYTARDCAHKRICDEIAAGKGNFLADRAVYYAGATDVAPNEVIGSIGPTSSYRMDVYTQILLKNGTLVSIGKGSRSKELETAVKQAGGVHFDAVGGAGVYYKRCVKSAEILRYPELLSEAIYRLTVEDFPVIVGICPD